MEKSGSLPSSIYIATPTLRGDVKATYVDSTFALQRICMSRGIDMQMKFLQGISLISHARNWLASQFLWNSDASHLLFIDDDIGFSARDVVAMFDWCDRDVVAAIYPSKSIDWERLKTIVLNNPRIEASALERLTGNYRNMYALRDGASTMTISDLPVQMDAIGTGLMLISRQCFKKLISAGAVRETAPGAPNEFPTYDFFGTNATNPGGAGEDIHFCRIVRAHGGEILGCPWPIVSHTGTYAHIGDLKAVGAALNLGV